MSLLRRVWHDPVGSKVISYGVIALLGWAGVHLPWGNLHLPAVGAWLMVATPITHLDIIASGISALAAGAAIGSIVLWIGGARRLLRDLKVGAPASREQQATPSPAAPPVSPRGQPEDLEQLIAGALKLDGRFAEEDAYRKAMVGRYIRYSGKVAAITSVSSAGDVQVCAYDTESEPARYVYAKFPPTFRERAFGLHMHDAITLTGKLTGSSREYAFVAGEDFQITALAPLLADIQERTAAAAPVTSTRKFEPEKFALTPARCRALLVLADRIDGQNTLHELHRHAVNVGPFRDIETTKAQLQQDMEDAERAGIVSVDRISPLTQCYALTVPDGRDWVNAHKAELVADGQKGMARRDARSPYG